MEEFTCASPYAAAFVLLRKGNKIAFVLRKNTTWMNGYYGLPSGKVEKDEPFSKGAIREAAEEVGVTIMPENLRHAITIHRHGPDFDWVDVYFEVDGWQGEVINAEPEVHSEVAWLDLDDLPDNIIPAVRYALFAVQAGERYAEYNWEGGNK